MKKWGLFSLIILTPLSALADVPAMMNKIVALRAELDTVNREMETDLKSRQAELDLWTQRRLELEGQLQKESLRKLQLDEKTKRLRATVKSQDKADPRSKEELLKWLMQAETWVKSSLPFRRGPRLEVIQGLLDRANRGLDSAELLASELWQFYETEMKLALDNEYRILEIEDLGQAEVARLGLYTLFAKSTDGSIRQAVLNEGVWSLKPLPDTDRPDIERLFKNLKNKNDQGLYAIPLAQPIEPKKSL